MATDTATTHGAIGAELDSIAALDGLTLAKHTASGDLTAEDVTTACLAQVETREPEVKAWTHLPAAYAKEQAARLDEHRATGRSLGRLHGVPVGVKDIFDTADMPTENGTVLDGGRHPHHDAWVVQRLRSQGAVILGKTATAELASSTPTSTTNPHDPTRTPGGSSSGSAAAVACHMVPLAVGSQTAGSVIRPAAYCGVVGYKPSFGWIPRSGMLAQAPSLDTVGVMGRTVADVALLAECLVGADLEDGVTSPRSGAGILDTATTKPPLTPCFAFAKQPAWDEAESDTREAFSEVAEVLGPNCDETDLPSAFARGLEIHRIIQKTELAKHYQGYLQRGAEHLSERMRADIAEGAGVLAHDYLVALDWQRVLGAGLEEIFERYDAILTPAATGEPAADLSQTGNPAFCALWTLTGNPTVTLPLLNGSHGLPMGVQLVGAKGDDARLLRTANWLMDHFQSPTETAG